MNSIAFSKNLVWVSLFLICTQASGAAVISDVVVGSNGQPLLVGDLDAKHYCGARGLRLPTAQEYAEVAVSLGADGVRETAFPNLTKYSAEVQQEIEQNKADGYKPIYWIKPIGKDLLSYIYVDFYYAPSNYQKPPGHLGDNRFWTSSDAKTLFHYEIYSFDGLSGTFRLDHPGLVRHLAFRCATDQ